MTLLSRYLAYSSERFPLLEHFAMACLLFFSGALLALNGQGLQPSFFFLSVFGILTVYLVFMRLRVFDEFKDYHLDNTYHRERPVQRGLISLRELGYIAAFAAAIEFLINLSLGREILLPYIAVFLFTMVMLREFFIGRILRKNILLYALPHVLIFPILGAYSFLFFPLLFNGPTNVAMLAFFCLSCYTLGLIFEVTRKLGGENIASSFMFIMGKKGAIAFVLGLMALSTIIFLLATAQMRKPLIWALMPAIFALFMVGYLLRQSKLPSALNSQKCGILGQAYIAGTFISLIFMAVV